jgi:hypothetical protein
VALAISVDAETAQERARIAAERALHARAHAAELRSRSTPPLAGLPTWDEIALLHERIARCHAGAAAAHRALAEREPRH